MKPRVFVSSTYYDLKYIRNNIEMFIDSYGYDSVLFESGNVTFDLDKKMDESCYDEVKNCHMMILIIGGRYGSKATTDDEKFIKQYELNYMSITRKEFKTTLEKGMPIFIFIDKNVEAEYKTFKENKELFYSLISEGKNEEKRILKFAHVDNINVFEFVNDVYQTGLPVYTFEKFYDIENQLRNQWAGLFYNYLSQINNNKRENKVVDTVIELKNITNRMNQMLQKVGEKVISEVESEEVISKQNETILKHFAEKIGEEISFWGGTMTKEKWEIIASFLVEKLFQSEFVYNAIISDTGSGEFSNIDNICNSINDDLDSLLLELGASDISLFEVNFDKIVKNYFEDIVKIINNKEEYKKIFINELASNFKSKCLPF